MKRQVNETKEGSETKNFWKSMGDKQPYANTPFDVDKVKFYAITTLSGAGKWNRVLDFITIDELTAPKAYLVDAFEQVHQSTNQSTKQTKQQNKQNKQTNKPTQPNPT